MSKNMKIKSLGNNIFLIIADNQYELTSTFVRIQEFYESPYDEIRGHDFDLDDFMDIYAKDHDGFTYFTDWTGFNVPGNIVNKFLKTMSYFRKKEIKLYELIKTEHNLETDDFYIIGCLEEDDTAIRHETAHALFYLNEIYNKEVTEHARVYKKEHPIVVRGLLMRGYDKSVIIDELQAYNIDNEPFKKIFEKYVNECNILI